MIALHPVGGARDEELLEHVAAGCEAALGELYDRHAGSVFSFTKRMVPDAGAAADIVEEVFLELWEAPHAFDGRLGGLRSHLLLLARRVTLVRLRRDRPVAAAGASELPSSSDLGVLEMALFGGSTCRQIADLLGITEREVKRRLRRGLQRVRSA
ncbi:MAG TPA: sigma factor [Acidimicrobiales bacterium]|nr:sigma factor [Acidimicrobiales bacterium]